MMQIKEGKLLTSRVEKTVIVERKIQDPKRKVFKNFRHKHTKFSSGAANLRSAPGGRHPTYATVYAPLYIT